MLLFPGVSTDSLWQKSPKVGLETALTLMFWRQLGPEVRSLQSKWSFIDCRGWLQCVPMFLLFLFFVKFLASMYSLSPDNLRPQSLFRVLYGLKGQSFDRNIGLRSAEILANQAYTEYLTGLGIGYWHLAKPGQSKNSTQISLPGGCMKWP